MLNRDRLLIFMRGRLRITVPGRDGRRNKDGLKAFCESCENPCRECFFQPLATDPYPLSALELSRPLLQERARAFVLVFGRAADGEGRGFEVEAFGESHVEAVIDGYYGVLHGQRSVGDDF